MIRPEFFSPAFYAPMPKGPVMEVPFRQVRSLGDFRTLLERAQEGVIIRVPWPEKGVVLVFAPAPEMEPAPLTREQIDRLPISHQPFAMFAGHRVKVTVQPL